MSWTGTGRSPGARSVRRSTKLTVSSTAAAAVVMLALVGYGAANAGTQATSGTSAAAAPCTDSDVPPTVEEARLDESVPGQSTPVGPEIIRRGGLTSAVDAFSAALCKVTNIAGANDTVDRFGRSLWEAAVTRAQGSDPAPDALPANDDRPLYWARLAMARQLRQWTPGFAADQADRDAWQRRLEYASRGLTTESFTPQAGTRKLFISGFDPFLLGPDTESGQDIRHSNPSGTVALRLDGRVLTVGGTRVQVQAVVLPVRFQDFTDGIVEDAFRPHVAAGEQHADMLTTISQGEPGTFHLEMYNGRRRSATIGDNLDVQGGGQRNVPFNVPQMGPGPEFTRSTLPVTRMQAAGASGPFPVEIRTQVMAFQPATRTVRTFPDGPPSESGWVSVEGGGGGYLSNESAYRVTRLVNEAGTSQPAGHIHTPELTFDPANTTEISDATLVANRTAIAEETERLLGAGITAIG